MSVYTIKNTSDNTVINWGQEAISPLTSYTLTIDNVDNGHDILTVVQYGTNTDYVSQGILEVHIDGLLRSIVDGKQFLTDYYNDPYNALDLGDMRMSTYDININGVVDNAETLSGHTIDYFTTSGSFDSHINDTSIHFPMSAIEGLVPSGGINGYVLKKYSNNDYEYSWMEDTGGSTSGGIPDAPDFNTYLRTSAAWVESNIFTSADYYDTNFLDQKFNEYTTSSDFENHVDDTDIHFEMSAIDHTLIKNIGTNTHTQIDTHISNNTIHAPLNDTTTTSASLWSSKKIQDELDGKEDSLGLGNAGQVLATNSTVDGKEWIDLPSSGGQVDSIVGGNGISVDETDPVNPIVSISATDITNLSGHYVTELFDVSGAGSGQIITDAERTKLLNDMERIALATQYDLPWIKDTNGSLEDSGYTIDDNTETSNVLWSASKIKSEIGSSGGGDVTGPSSSTDGHISIFNGDTGKVIKDGGIGVSELATINDLALKEDSLGNPTIDGQVLSSDTGGSRSWVNLPEPGITEIQAGNHISIDNSTTSKPLIYVDTNDITDLSGHYVTELFDVTSAGSGEIITSDERTKLNGIESGAEVNVQSDWNITDTNSDAYILNKPDIIQDVSDNNTYLRTNSSWINSDVFTSANYYNQTDIDSLLSTKTDTSAFDDHKNDLDIHRELDDSQTSTTTLWSSDKINQEITNSTSGLGDVTGPSSSTTDNIAVFNDNTGKVIKDGGVKISNFATSAALETKEDSLGNPTIDGQVLSSQTDGTRSWTTIPSAPVTSVNSKTGDVVLNPDDLDDTSTTNKFVTQTDITNWDNKLDSVTSDSTLSGDGTSGSPLSVDIVIDDVNDVDTTTNIPTNDQILQWDGTNWIPADLPTQTTPTLDDVTSQGASSSNIMSYTGTPTFNNDLEIPDKKYVDDKTKPLAGIADDRPAGSVLGGTMYYATDLGYPIWFDPTNSYWVNATGSYVLPGI